MLKAEDIEKNINTYQQVPSNLQDALRVGNWRIIIDMIESMTDITM